MTQEYDTTTERKLWFSGAWGRSLPTSFLQFGPDCIACDEQVVQHKAGMFCDIVRNFNGTNALGLINRYGINHYWIFQ